MDSVTVIIIVLVVVLVLIVALGGVYLFMSSRDKKKNKKTIVNENGEQISQEEAERIESMNRFLDFDEVKDNMIIRKNRTQYVMVLQCQGVNYDLLSEAEKMAVEEGFVQFLNTLRFPIQLYVQTRSLNLKDIIEQYRTRMRGMKEEIDKLKIKLEQIKRTGNLNEIERIEFDIRRKENVLVYGVDISEYIARMSQNSNILQQKTYIVVSYYAVESGDLSKHSKEEVDNICFSELYTRCQSLIRTLGSAEVLGRILSSEELAELLYVAYNREDSETLQLSKVLDAEYDSLYSKGKDVLLKRQEQLDEQIEVEAIDLATESILAADRKRQEEQEAKEARVKEKALELIDNYKEQMDPELYEGAKEQIKQKRTIKRKKAV